ncbi:hypothetical protein [Novosphingobium sp. KN65.2]|uniref:hypothetical protein n=1 Tax=Novosphingobium sp. KN65.2 TaxID=1478134 RepID=UPI0005DAE4CD|nr:hypothetical protein [Novosphingobium sp. KN65.2]CDO35026.1 hypothetical protein SPHV1_2180038 [Novosphingobium sp. KN65.2]
MTEPLSAIATRVWLDRSAIADEYVTAGKWSREDADKRLRPWVAICLLAGASLDAMPADVAAEVEALRHPIVFIAGKGAPVERDHVLPEDVARVDVANDWCAPLRWSRDLGEATNRAADRHTANPSEAALAAWRDLAAISRALDVTVPWRERPSAIEVANPERIAA